MPSSPSTPPGPDLSLDPALLEDAAPSELEIEEYLESRVVRRRLFPRAILVGLVSGCVATAFRFAILGAESLRMKLVSTLPNRPELLFLVVTVLATLGTYLALLIGRWDKDAGGSGIPHMKAVLEGHSTLNWARLIGVKFSAAVTAIGSGLALGREGPTVQMGGAAGDAVAQLTGASKRERRALTAAGAGSGLAAAFNSPLAGVTFVLEELQRDFQPVVFGATLLSATVATVVSRLASGQVPAFAVPPIETPSLVFLPVFLVIGVVGGLVGVLFNRGLMASSAFVAKFRAKNVVGVSIIAGLLTAAVFTLSPSLLGGGHDLTESVIHGKILFLPALAFLLVRFLFVHASYSTGVAGGIFAPLLSIGALLGLVAYYGVTAAVPSGLSLPACVVAGMCALFSGVVRAPLTGIILIAEMTGSYDLLLPLLAAAFTAYAVAEGLGDTPIYEAILQREAAKKGWNLEDGELHTAEYEIVAGAPYDGKKIRDLGLPEGVLVILCRQGGKESVPRANTVLKASMRIVIATSSSKGLRDVQVGTGARPANR